MFNTIRIKTEIEDDCLNIDDNQLEPQAVDVVVKIEKPDNQLEADNVKANDKTSSGIDNDLIISNNLKDDDLSVFCVPIYANFGNSKLNYSKREPNILNNEESSLELIDNDVDKDVVKDVVKEVDKNVPEVKETNYVEQLQKRLYGRSKRHFTTDKLTAIESNCFNCPMCKYPCKSQVLLENHLKAHPHCDQCSFITLSEFLLKLHKRSQHETKENPRILEKKIKDQKNYISPITIISLRESKISDSKMSYSKKKSNCDNNLTAPVSSTIKHETVQHDQHDQTGNCGKKIKIVKKETLDSTQTFEVKSEKVLENINGNNSFVGTSILTNIPGLATNSGLAGNSSLVGNSILTGNTILVANSGMVTNLGLTGNLGLANCNSLGVYYPPSKISEAEKAILARYRPIAANPKPVLNSSQISNLSSPNSSSNPNPNPIPSSNPKPNPNPSSNPNPNRNPSSNPNPNPFANPNPNPFANPNPNPSSNPNPKLSTILRLSANPSRVLIPSLDFEKECIKWKHSCKQCQYLTNNNSEFQKHLSFKYIKCSNCTSTFHAQHELSDHDCQVKRNQKANIIKIVSVSSSTETLKIDKNSKESRLENPYAGNEDISIIPDIIEEDNLIEATKKSTNHVTSNEIDIGYKIKIEPSSPCPDSEDEYDTGTGSDNKSSCDDLIFKCMMCEEDFETENDLTFHNCGQFIKKSPIKQVTHGHGKRKTPHETKSCYQIEYDDDGLYDTEEMETIFTNNDPPQSKIRVLEEMRERIRSKMDNDFSEDEEEEICFSDSVETIDSDDSEKPIYQITFDDSDEDAEPFDCEVTTEPFDCEVTEEPNEINSD